MNSSLSHWTDACVGGEIVIVHNPTGQGWVVTIR